MTIARVLPGLWSLLFLATLVLGFMSGMRVIRRLSSDSNGFALGLIGLLVAECFVAGIAGLAANFVGQ